MQSRNGSATGWISCLMMLGLFCVTSTGVHALEERPGYDQITLTTVAEGTVARDVMIATVVARHEGPSLEALTSDTNREIKNALEKAKKVVGLKVQTQEYQTVPTYQDQKPFGWVVQQSIRIESREPEKLSALLGDLQKTLKLESMQYEIAPEARKSIEDHLIQDGLRLFQERAEQITKTLGRTRYRLVKLDIGNEPSQFRTPRALARMQANEAPSQPMFETGEAHVTITVQGTIELQPN